MLRLLIGSLCASIIFLPSANASQPVDPSTLTGKIMSGYQGWFRTPGDGSNRDWFHYGRNFGPENFAAIEMWPDVSELDDDEKVPTAFRHEDGSVAHVFSSRNRKTVARHFQWMEEYGTDGVFLQRFIGVTRNDAGRNDNNVVMDNVRYGAEKHNRAWAMMYDLTGARPGDMMGSLVDDWKKLVDESKIREDRMYLHHNGKPVVSIWGIGFSDGRRYTLAECLELITFLKDDPQYGGNTVKVGVPTFWRTLDRDAIDDPLLHEIIRKADIVSPWTVGRYHTPREAANHTRNVAAADLAWSKENGVEYMPVVFPGFSWHNLYMGRNQPERARFNLIPRLKGEFLSTQLRGNMNNGVTMIYQAMFDEIDEATAIFKVSDNPPVGGVNRFIDMEGLPSDFYLKMLGEAAKELKQRVGR
ncbi:MAG: glycoside hydrolase family 71/99-like protein [Planctomycetaceae bacterium]|nr:glycoside hydrolase family 71/99-like protein [Planctomycetaceae bacterium]